jgi:hypothetical protein
MYKLEKIEQSLFTDDSWCFALDFSRTVGRLKRRKLFRLIGPLTRRVWETRRSLTNVSFCFCPVFSRLCIVLITAGSARSMVARTSRSLLSSTNGFPMDGLPPTQAALVEHTKRAAYQAGQFWAQMFVHVAVPKLPFSGEWGWQKMIKGGWEVK